MSRLIDADDLEIYRERFDTYDDYSMVFDMIDSAPTVDAEPVRHGHWEVDGHHIRCSRCGTYMCNTDREGDAIPTNYCPNCGADMRETE